MSGMRLSLLGDRRPRQPETPANRRPPGHRSRQRRTASSNPVISKPSPRLPAQSPAGSSPRAAPEIGATPAIGTVGDIYPNALARTGNGYSKAELIRAAARRGSGRPSRRSSRAGHVAMGARARQPPLDPLLDPQGRQAQRHVSDPKRPRVETPGHGARTVAKFVSLGVVYWVSVSANRMG